MNSQNRQPHVGIDAEQGASHSISLHLHQIAIDQAVQQRADHLDEQVIEEYVKAMLDGVSFPPVVVFGDEYILTDGFHRVEAAKKARLTVELEGSKREPEAAKRAIEIFVVEVEALRESQQ